MCGKECAEKSMRRRICRKDYVEKSMWKRVWGKEYASCNLLSGKECAEKSMRDVTGSYHACLFIFVHISDISVTFQYA